MSMSPRLLRPKAGGFHPDASDWRARVIANSGSVSASTMKAVSTFCDSIASAGIRDRFYRMNLFCGSFQGAFVPLYRGPSLGGTQYGNATDTNVGGLFVSGNYSETGASGGLAGDGSSKYLDTGFTLNTLPSTTSGHASVYCHNRSSNNGFFGMVGAGVAGSTGLGVATDTNVYGAWGAFSFASNASNGLLAVTRVSSTSQTTYVNASSIATNTTSTTPASQASGAVVFCERTFAGVIRYYDPRRYQFYSIGTGLSQEDMSSLNSAVHAFQSALMRQA